MGKSGLSTRQLERLRFTDLLSKIRIFLRDVKAEDFAMLPVDPTKKIQYRGRFMPRKRKGGSPPRDFQAVEDFIDLELAMNRGDFSEAIGLYFKLKKLLNW